MASLQKAQEKMKRLTGNSRIMHHEATATTKLATQDMHVPTQRERPESNHRECSPKEKNAEQPIISVNTQSDESMTLDEFKSTKNLNFN